MKRTFCALLASVLAFASGPVSADGERSNSSTIPHVLRISTAEDPQGLNPDIVAQSIVGFLSQMTMAYLFRSDHDNNLEPELATTIPTLANGGIAADGKSVTIHLRKGVKWSDGEAFDADDVAFSIAVMNNPANNVTSREGFDRIVKVDVPDKYTVVVHLRERYGFIVPTLFASVGNAAILPKHILGSLPDINAAPYNNLPVGIGPFRYAAWKRGDSVELEANPLYWRGRPKLERVIMKLIPDRNTILAQLQTGELDMWFPTGGAYLARIQAIPSATTLREPSNLLNEMIFNVKSPGLDDPVVRRAMELATDRATLRAKVGHGVGLLQDVSAPTFDAAVPKNIPFTAYDPAKANALLDKDGWVRGADGIREKNGKRLSFQVASSSGTPDVDTQIELIRTFWQPVGIEMTVQRYESAMLFAPKANGGIIMNSKFDVAFIAWSYDLPMDPTNLYSCKRFPPDGQNTGNYCNPKVDALLADLHSTYDQGRYRSDLAKILTIIAQDVPVIVMTGRENIYGFNKDLKNFRPNSVTEFDDMMNVDI